MQIFESILVLITILNAIKGYSISDRQIENTNTFIETTIPLKMQYLGSKQNHIITYSTYNNRLDVRVSNDYGLTFTNKLDQFLIKSSDTSVPAYLHEIYISPNGQFVVFTDIINDALFISTNFGEDFNFTSVNFKPSKIGFYGEGNQFVVFDDTHKTLYFTNNNGSSFNVLKDNVSRFEWRTINELNQNLFIEVNSSSIYIFNGIDQTINEWQNISEVGIRQFQVVENYVFIMTNKNDVYFTYKSEPLTEAKLYPHFACEAFHVAAIEEHSIKLAVVHKSETRLYVGNYRKNTTTINFVLSLKNIVSHSPKITWNSTLIRINKPFTELYSVEGLTGVYIANVHLLRLYSKLDHFSISDIRTVITLDNGATWKHFDAHFYDRAGNFIDCTTHCRLKLNSNLFDAVGLYHYKEIKSSRNVIGLIIATGVGQSQSEPQSTRAYQFISNDMGKSWHKVLDGFYNLNIGNNGGIIIAVKSQGTTKELLYSFNYGDNWNAYLFYDHEITVLELFTLDKHNSTKFYLVGYDGVRRRQMFITLDFKNMLLPNCTTNSKDSVKNKQKIFGKIIEMKETVARNCLNFKPNENFQKSRCDITDFECDDGYFRNNLTSLLCQPIYMDCQPGSFYTTGNIRKIERNECLGTVEILPQNIACPNSDIDEFILVANGTKVHQLNILSKTSLVVIESNTAIRAIDFDIKSKCLYYSEFAGQIKRYCADAKVEILVPGTNTWYKSLTYDNVFKVLYYLDAYSNKVSAVHTDNLNWGAKIKINDLLLEKSHQLIYVNPGEQTIYIRGDKQIIRGKIFHVNGEISVQDFELTTLPYEFNKGDTFTINKIGNELIVNDWYTHKKGSIFKNTYENKILATGFTSVHDMQFVRLSDIQFSNGWSCISGENISRQLVCDGNFDCSYGDDESSCEIRYKPDKFYSSLPFKALMN